MSKMSELKEYIDKKLRLAKLDSALLFFSSSLSLAFSVGYAFLGARWLQYYLPMLFLGWFMPIYIGYVRGSLIVDSIEERVRGWIYFIMGLGFYVVSPLLGFLVEEILKVELLYAGLVTLITSAVFGLSYSTLQSKVVYDIFKIQRKSFGKEVRRAFRETRGSALFLAILLVYISRVDFSKLYSKLDFVLLIMDTVIIVGLVGLFVVILLGEREARRLLRNTPHTTPYSPDTTRKKV